MKKYLFIAILLFGIAACTAILVVGNGNKAVAKPDHALQTKTSVGIGNTVKNDTLKIDTLKLKK